MLTSFFESQLAEWPLAAKNYADLANVRTRIFDFDGFAVQVQCNPARMVSSGAKLDSKTLASRPCFLCAANRPAEQRAILTEKFEILVNPFPIFSQHFTIARTQHEPQQIADYFADLLKLTKQLEGYTLFYNGPKCGASAPDHMHFQACPPNELPLISDYERLKKLGRVSLENSVGSAKIYRINDYLRTVFCLEGKREDALQIAFLQLYNAWISEPMIEPMMNVVARFSGDVWQIFVMPRRAFRPWQYTADEPQRLLISPATVEMAGLLITPVLEHFERITKADIVDIFSQIS